jgi:phage baseplate assembly protein W
MSIPTVFRSYEVDSYPDRAVGVLLPFNGDSVLVDIKYPKEINRVADVKAFRLSYSTEEQAITNLVNLLLTRKGERLMQPNFGSLIPEFLFEPNNERNRQLLEDSVIADIEFWLPYILLDSVNVVSQSDIAFPDSYADHNVQIQISFRVTNIGANRTVTFFVDGANINFEIE